MKQIKEIFVSIEDYKSKARNNIDQNIFDYYKTGACGEQTLHLNSKSFRKLRIRPRVFRNVGNRNMSCEIFGDTIKMPMGIAPTALQKLANCDGEIGNARAAQSAGIVFTLSSLSTTSIEDVAKAAPDCVKWLQINIYRNREITKSLIRRAEKAGFKALVLSVDIPVVGIRRVDTRNPYKLPADVKFANFEDEFMSKCSKVSGINDSKINKYACNQFDATLDWSDLSWLVGFTKLPVIVKGILTEEDALLSVLHGAKGIIVSNHGGRQLDGVPATIEVLPEIVRAVGEHTTVILDGGISEGTDIFKALALGAKMVLIGRAAIWGLAAGGQSGVEGVIEILRKEFDIAMALSGCRCLSKIEKNMVVHENHFCKL